MRFVHGRGISAKWALRPSSPAASGAPARTSPAPADKKSARQISPRRAGGGNFTPNRMKRRPREGNGFSPPPPLMTELGAAGQQPGGPKEKLQTRRRTELAEPGEWTRGEWWRLTANHAGARIDGRGPGAPERPAVATFLGPPAVGPRRGFPLERVLRQKPSEWRLGTAPTATFP
jgi:hypothetical protein